MGGGCGSVWKGRGIGVGALVLFVYLYCVLLNACGIQLPEGERIRE